MSYSIPHTARVTGLLDGTHDPSENAIAVGETRERKTRRWYGVTVFALIALGLGLILTTPSLLLASALGLAFTAYGRVTAPPPSSLSIDRTVSDPDPEPGDVVRITVRVRNDASRPIFDCRVIDGVPSSVSVVEGSPRHGTVLRSGGETEFTYAIEATRGDHVFDPALVVARDASGATERTTAVEATTSVSCTPRLPADPVSIPVRSQLTRYTGRVTSETDGPGIEFSAVREYRRGDAFNRIDWNRTARTGELATVEYRTERAASVVLLVDARASTYRSAGVRSVSAFESESGSDLDPDPDPDSNTPSGSQSALERSVEAARTAAASLFSAGHGVGLMAMSPHGCWIPPARADDHRVRIRNALATHDAFSPISPTDSFDTQSFRQALHKRVSEDAQIIVFSPLCDDYVAQTTIRLDARRQRVTVISPDPTTDDSPGHQLARIDRALRVTSVRSRGIPVVDWTHGTSLEQAVARTKRRWSA
ncbi:DUF58 domain-containing protein [Halobacteria archaeon AArc-m2/3/4]|uniref:DUF58 domain-containing protein n=1 Tax=Natronoglomus mannanivorans TaxID=2979990 RepID=A0AAP2YXS0_9EURY|nr:DUF58 domain-containing protein [Halobacteria archaeon AArc-xg1-1]MCU4973719.1 DUF58 domain-containing protein [Halobacteria archaeon AArc-m2/3/4]